MKRTMIDYGIDLGTTNSAISRAESGDYKIIKSLDSQKDITPSSVAFNRKGAIFIGESAYNIFRLESIKAMKKPNAKFNSFIEYKRTMGTDATYTSSFKGQDFHSEDLSAEVLKHLKGYVQDEIVNSAVITIPAGYTANQIDAVKRAGKLAGFSYVETLQEPVAAAMAYGIDNTKDGYWLVFDFGGGTYDSALIKVDEGIVKVIDTEGDNYLGGKDLDFAIVDKVIIPHIQDEFELDDLLSDSEQRAAFRNAFKFYAEDIKNNLSFKDSYQLYVDPGDCGEDDDGEEIEIDLVISQSDLENVFAPVLQRAIDLSNDLLSRNNLTGDSLDSLILVGGPTLSPILREMVAEQICKPDTSVDPMTVVSRGAAIYASTRSLPENVLNESRDSELVQLSIDFESSSVELEEFVSIKLATDKMNSDPGVITVQLRRNDGAWMSEKIEISERGEIFDVELVKGKTNSFDIVVFDSRGSTVEVQPSSFNIIQGSVLGSMTLPHNFGIEVFDTKTEKAVFAPIQGLEKNKSLPATGVYTNLKTQQDIRPGNASDNIKIPLYQGGSDAKGSRAIYNEHVYNAIITGADIPSMLPAGSIINLLVRVDESQTVSFEAEIPSLDFTFEVTVPSDKVQSVDTNWLSEQINKARNDLYEQDDYDSELHEELNRAEEALESNANDVDTQMQTRNKLREVMKQVDKNHSDGEWGYVDGKIRSALERCHKANNDIGTAQTTSELSELESAYRQIKASEDVKSGRHLVKQLNDLHFTITRFYQLIDFIQGVNQEFNSINWKDRFAARNAIDEGLNAINTARTADDLQHYVGQIFQYMPDQVKGGSGTQYDNSLLIG
ncbi:Hsp70 family protein [Vibrio rarus]|uniref:Hsp70 family protein n=1 Tax=Vibrio rarus TaxID=413403 RepID=UPI0021C46DA7|nr:Hsp70 family protein [Vibrio rarus]